MWRGLPSKSRSTLERCLRELVAKGVCEWDAEPN